MPDVIDIAREELSARAAKGEQFAIDPKLLRPQHLTRPAGVLLRRIALYPFSRSFVGLMLFEQQPFSR